MLDSEVSVVGALPVRELLEALPGCHRIHAGHLLYALHIGERCTAGELSERQGRRLREIFPHVVAT